MSGDRRYQIFISSTFIDLVEERQAVLKAILEIDHMPAGMELFPASDETAWELIKSVIDDSDYYVLIIGGRYGSHDKEGISFTEKEYNYAIETGKYVLPFLHEDISEIKSGKTDEGVAKEKLLEFRKKVQSTHTCKFWTNSDNLQARVTTSLMSAFKKKPAIGWIRANQGTESESMKKIIELQTKVELLENELEHQRTTPPLGTEQLQQGQDNFEVNFSFKGIHIGDSEFDTFYFKFSTTWDSIFSFVAPKMIAELDTLNLQGYIKRYLEFLAQEELESGGVGSNFEQIGEVTIARNIIDTVILQFRALSLIKESQKKRSLRDSKTYWSLTPYGDNKMVQLCALIKKDLD